ncbi:MAG TPA: Smr/MutS family protein, partial [Candidatus Dormibacteraeota bacterium]|nr:Smr/MutS family protein [Candidatus Dormibacteraeota bacterium]
SYAAALLPCADFANVKIEQARTAALRRLIIESDLHVAAAIECEELVDAAAVGRTLPPGELRAIADALAAAASLARALRDAPEDSLAALLALYGDLGALIGAVREAIDERGAVLDRASPALGRLRRGIVNAQNEARERVTGIMRSSRYANAIQEHLVTMREGRFVVPVKAEFSGEFPGIVHDTSGSGQTLFIEPLAALDANNRVRTMRIEEEREVERILTALSRQVGDERDRIAANIEFLARIDVIAAKAQLAIAMDALEPEMLDACEIDIHAGRHPLLGERAVAQSLALDERRRVLVISGPNMGGKTVALKLAGLFVAMAYAGLQLPTGSGTRVGRFSRVIADIGDAQSILTDASTFSAHLNRLRAMLEVADARTLLLVDEIGGGTEPAAGAALAVAAIEAFLAVGARAVVTTHATELKLMAHATDAVENASVRFDPTSFRPTYQLDIGAPGQSLAFALARSMALPEATIARAQALLEDRERDYEEALAQLAQRNSELQSERESMQSERSALQSERALYEAKQRALIAERDRFSQRAEETLAGRLREFAAELARNASERAARPRVTSAQTRALARAIDDVRGELGIEESERERSEVLGALQPDERIYIRSLRQEARVVEDYGARVHVAIGALRSVVERSDLERRPSSQRKGRPEAAPAKLEAVTRSSAELDVRGKRFVDAEPLVERWIDDALLAGSTQLRLIHGKGTGLLGRGLQEHLRAHPAVESLRFGNADEGGGGVTILQLRG